MLPVTPPITFENEMIKNKNKKIKKLKAGNLVLSLIFCAF
jgi:hypothetical protein